MKNSRWLVVFGVLVIAAGIGFYYVSSTSHVNGKDTGGAIGAVQKHREAQIAASDVVLGDEQFRNETETLYADFLKDAALLEERSVALGIFARGIDVREHNLEAFEANVESMDREIESRFSDAGEGAIGMVDVLMKQQLLEAFHADLLAMRRGLELVEKLDVKQLQAYEQELGKMSDAIEARAADMNEMEAMTRDVNAMISKVEAREEKLDVKQLAAMEAELGKMASGLDLQRKLDVRMLQSRVYRLDGRFREMRTLMEARDQMEAFSKHAGVKADVMEARKQDLLEVSKSFVGIADMLEGRAITNMQGRYTEMNVRADQLAGIREQLIGLRKGLDAEAQALDVRATEQAIESFDNALEVRYQQIGSRIADSMQAELGLIDRHIESHVRLQSRMQESLAKAEVAGLEARNADLAELGLVADLKEIRHELESLSKDIETSAFVKAEARERLSHEAQAIEAKSANL